MKKLKLNKETVSFLNEANMKQVGGGITGRCNLLMWVNGTELFRENSGRQSCIDFVGPIDPNNPCRDGFV